MSAGAWVIVGLVLAFGAGWVVAHHVVATECEKLGRFYVGSRVYECRPPTPTQAGAGAQEVGR